MANDKDEKSIDMPEENDGYRESEDEDYNPTEEGRDGDISDSENGSDSDADASSEVKSQVKTRRQREEEKNKDKYEEIKAVKAPTVDVDDLWAKLNQKPAAKEKADEEKQEDQEKIPESASPETITIKRRYEFAGKVHTEEKTVPISSSEAQDYLKQLEAEKREESKSAKKPKGGPRRKKRSSLMDEYESGRAKKMNTLEKTRLDWMGFVDKEGIKDELQHHNKGGYLQKQDFLSRVEQRQDDLRKSK